MSAPAVGECTQVLLAPEVRLVKSLEIGDENLAALVEGLPLREKKPVSGYGGEGVKDNSLSAASNSAP